MTTNETKPAAWAAHTGLDYTVVMRPDETTDTASIQVFGEGAQQLGRRIATLLSGHERALDVIMTFMRLGATRLAEDPSFDHEAFWSEANAVLLECGRVPPLMSN